MPHNGPKKMNHTRQSEVLSNRPRINQLTTGSSKNHLLNLRQTYHYKNTFSKCFSAGLRFIKFDRMTFDVVHKIESSGSSCDKNILFKLDVTYNEDEISFKVKNHILKIKKWADLKNHKYFINVKNLSIWVEIRKRPNIYAKKYF